MDGVKVSISNKQKAVKIPTGIRLLVRRCCSAVLTMEDFQGAAEVSVSFVDNEQIKQLNNEFRDKNTATDVLSFPLGENGAYMLGDIVISVERAIEQAQMYGHSLRREIGFLTVHSMLHLLGYDHEGSNLEALRMREKEELVLTKLGLQRDMSFVGEEDVQE